MQVRLRRPFVIDGLRYRVAAPGSFTEMPEHLRGRLPKTAVIRDEMVDGAEDKPAELDGIADLRAADPQRAMAESSDAEALLAAGMAGLADASASAAVQQPTASDKRSAKAQAENRAAKKAARAKTADEAVEKVNAKK